jgi:hypothetical protein
MYQSLICLILRRQGRSDKASGLAAVPHTKFLESDANTLVDRVRADPQLYRDFLAIMILEHQQQAFDLPGA